MAESESYDGLCGWSDDEQRYPHPKECQHRSKRCVDVGVVSAWSGDGSSEFRVA